MKRLSILFLASFLSACAALSTPVPTETPQPTPTVDQLLLAEETLVTFFDLLNAGDYNLALQFQGGPPEFIEELQIFNPDVAPNDYAGLLAAACTYQYLCLRVKEVLSSEQVSQDEFHFVVQFADENGDLFVYGPCCGADPTEEPPVTEFEYTVLRISGRLRVLRGPIYVP